ncbi:MAG: NAD-dependent epimerase/dehydratase family protein [Myxococcota bacterium]
MTRILLTGGAGFIGSHFAEHVLRDETHALWIVDNFDPFYDRRIKEANLEAIRKNPRARIREVDLTDRSSLHQVMEEAQPEVIVHLAAKAGVRPSIEDPNGYVRANVVAWTELLQLATEFSVKKIVFGSSSSVYGNSNVVPFSESDPVMKPISPYAATKRAGELIAHTFHHIHGLSVVCLRFFTVYGPRQRPDLAIHKFARRILDDQPITLFGDGSTSRDYTYIDDIVAGVFGSIAWLKDQESPAFEIFNLGNSTPCTLRDLVTGIEEALQKKARIEWAGMQPGDVVRTFADIRRAQDLLGYDPKTDLSTGLARFAEWIQRT